MGHRYLSRDDKLRCKGLLDMFYTPSELSWETGIAEHRLREVLPGQGMPVVTDAAGSVWIHGLEFKAWVESFSEKRRAKLGPGEGLCLKCKMAVPMVKPSRVKSYMGMALVAICPTCGKKVYRAVSTKRAR